MFPERDKSAKVKQELRLLQLLDNGNDNGEALLRTALRAGARKVVVKRPLKGPLLGNLPAAYSLRGKAIRFDVYLGSLRQALRK
jgi:16S rRNA (guanine1516-N2)-methyltransferase